MTNQHITMPEPVVWRSRYRSPQGMIGHYPWSYVGHSLIQPALNNYDIESLITTDQAESYANARVRAALEDLIDTLETRQFGGQDQIIRAARALIPKE